MNLVTIVQARMGSTRLPGKVLETVGDRTILEWAIGRVRQAPTLADSPIVVATSARGHDDPIAELCAARGFDCYRSSEHDVLNRYTQTAAAYQADAVFRVTADCPLLDPHMADQLARLMAADPTVDYTAFQGAPEGLTQEAFSVNALYEAWALSSQRKDREHVITWMLRSPSLKRAFVTAPIQLQPFKDLHFSVDTQDDLDRLRAMFHLSDGTLFAKQALELVQLSQAVMA